MKISDVRVHTVGVELEEPLGLSREREIPSRSAALVEIETDNGLIGIGEGYGPEPYIVETIVEEKYAPRIVGDDPLDRERIWNEMLTDDVYWDQKGQGVSAASGVDMALWDIAGKYFDVPIHKLAGGNAHGSDRIRAYASDLFWDSPEAMAERAGEYVERGFQAVKTHLGRGLKADQRRVRALREAIGDARLMIDMNCGYDRTTALRVGQMLEDYPVFWYEEPLSPYDVEGYAWLRERLEIPIATGENEYTKWGFLRLFQENGVDYPMPDIMRCGGITETLKIAHLAEAFHLPCSPHCYTTGVGLAATLQIMACLPNAQWLELDVTDFELYESFLTSPLDIDGEGRVAIPTDPGLGVTLDEETVRQFKLE